MDTEFEIPYGLDLAAVGLAAVQGAIMVGAEAKAKAIDFLGVILVGIACGVGGGIIRDVLLGAPLVALQSNGYILTAVGGAVLGMALSGPLSRLSKFVVVLDAASLGMYLVVGVVKAAGFGVAVVPSVFVGVLACTGGAVIRDVLLHTEVALVKVGTFYALAALGGAVSYMATHTWLGDLTAGFVAISVTFLLRVGSYWRGWVTPLPDALDLSYLRRKAQRIRPRSGMQRR